MYYFRTSPQAGDWLQLAQEVERSPGFLDALPETSPTSSQPASGTQSLLEPALCVGENDIPTAFGVLRDSRGEAVPEVCAHWREGKTERAPKLVTYFLQYLALNRCVLNC